MKDEIFPIDVFPKYLKEYCIELANSVNVNVSIVACSILPILAGMIGKTRKVQIKSGHTEPSNIWGIIVANSGYGKTPVFNALLKPVYSIEKKMFQEYIHEKKVYIEMKDAGMKAVKPIRKSLVVSDITTEAVAKVLENNPNGVIIYRDELAGFIGSFGKYNNGKGSDEAFFLELFNGGTIKVDRKDESKSVFVPEANASFVGGIQPSVFKEVFKSNNWSSGLVPRFLIHPAKGDFLGYSLKTVPEKLQLEYDRLIIKLKKLRDNKSMVIAYDNEALMRFVEWTENYLAPKMSDNKSNNLSESLSKMATYIHRIALILQCCIDPNVNQIEEDVVVKAIRVVEWYVRKLEPFQKSSSDDTDNIIRLVRKFNGFITPVLLTRNSRAYDNANQARRRLLELTKDGKLEMLCKDGEFGFEIVC